MEQTESSPRSGVLPGTDSLCILAKTSLTYRLISERMFIVVNH